MKETTTSPDSSVQNQAKPYLKPTAIICYRQTLAVFTKLAVENLDTGSIAVAVLLGDKAIKSVSVHKTMADAFDSSVNKIEGLAAPFHDRGTKNSKMWSAFDENIGAQFHIAIDAEEQIVYVGTNSAEVLYALMGK